MQFPESWLREFCDPPLSSQQLADLLTMSGMEVEECRPVAPPFSRVVVAEIVEAGEVFVRLHRRPFGVSRVPFAIELIEAERVADEHSQGYGSVG